MEKRSLPSKEELLWLFSVFFVLSLLFSLPYIVGAMLTPPGSKFLGLLRLKDDLAVYLSWIEQVRQGHLLFVNLFTNIQQNYPFFNFFAFLMGILSRLFHLPPLKLLFISRYFFAFCLLLLLYIFLSNFFTDKESKKIGLLTVIFSSGAGWLTGGYSPARGFENSVDLWQPESTVFFTIYVNPLFAFALLLILGFFLSLLKWKGLKGGLIAGFCLLFLANVHTYDVLIVGVVWIIYIALLTLKNKKVPWRDILNALIALLVSLPAIYYQLYLLQNEPLFSKRAEVPTLSPSFYWYLIGMGFLIPLAIFSIVKKLGEKRTNGSLLFLIAWVIAGFLLPYLPFSFQRKLFMGTQIPLAVLAAYPLVPLVKKRLFPLVLVGLFLSNGVILGTDIYSLIANEPLYPQPTYLSEGEIEALDWFRENSRKEEVILAIPDFACYIPALIGRRVYAGHWGETPNYNSKYKEVLRFYKAANIEGNRIFLKENRIKFVYYGDYERFLAPEFLYFEQPFLELVFHNEEARIWRVRD